MAVSSLRSIPMRAIIPKRLIRLSGVEFASADAGVAWGGDPNSTFDNNRTVEDCSSPTNTAIVHQQLRQFRECAHPDRQRPMTAIFTIYSGDPELILRTTEDVSGMTDTRCDGDVGHLTVMSIDSVRLAYTGTTTAAPSGKKIRGIVTSDYTNSNLVSQNLTIQDATGALSLFVSGSSHSFTLGTEIEVNISGQELSEFNGWLQVNNVPLGNATAVGTGTVTPRTATIAGPGQLRCLGITSNQDHRSYHQWNRHLQWIADAQRRLRHNYHVYAYRRIVLVSVVSDRNGFGYRNPIRVLTQHVHTTDHHPQYQRRTVSHFAE